MIWKTVKYGAVTAGVVTIAGGLLLGTEVFSYMRTSANQVQSAVKDSIPMEFELARAREMYEQVLAENPSIWSAKNDLAWVLAEEGQDLDRALALARDAHVASGQSATTADTTETS